MIKLQELRVEKGISQAEISTALGITQQAYSRYERGTSELGYEKLLQFAKFFDVSVDYLLGNSPFYYPDSVKSDVQAADSNEETLLRYFRALSSELKGVALETVRVLAGIPASGLQKKA